jgi:pectate lyase
MKKVSILLLLCFCVAPVIFAQVYAKGDVNHSGAIDIVDALTLAQYTVGLNPANFDTSLADCNSSGNIDIVDALLIAQLYVGLITQFPGATTTVTATRTSTRTATAVVTPTPTNPPTVTGPVGWGRNTTGGTGGSTVNVTSFSALVSALDSSSTSIVVIQNNISAGEQMIDVQGNKTIMGAGSGVSLDFGFYLRGSNVIIKNLNMMNGGFNTGDSEGSDCVSWASNLQNVWIDHCTFHEAMDGLVDPTRNARYVTISYCRFYHQKTAVLIGGDDSDSAAESAQSNSDKSQWHYTVTMHHCWFDDCYERCPRVRYGAVHLFNNYIANCPTYAVGKGVGANVYSENNYFYNTTSVWKAYDSSSQPGYIDDVGSLFEGSNGTTTDFPPPSNWAWKPSTYYSYATHTAAWVKANLQNYAGVGKGNP